jgi:hypothetical protein
MKEFANTLVSNSVVFESDVRVTGPSHELMGNLAEITTRSVSETDPDKQVLAPAAASESAQTPAPGTAAFHASKNEYRPALKDDRLAQALAQLQSMKQKNRPNLAPRIVTSHFRPEEFTRVDFHKAGKVHPPRKPSNSK